MKSDSGIASLIEAAQISALFSRAKFVFSINVICSVIVGAFLWNSISNSILLTWVLAVTGITAFRFHLLLEYDRDQAKAEHLDYWKRVAVWGAAASGIAWGISWIFLFPHQSFPQQIFLLVVILGMMAGSSVSWHAYFPSFQAYFLSTALLTSVRFILVFLPGNENRVMFAAMGALFLLFTAGLYSFARNSNQLLSKVFTSQNEKLASDERYRALFRGAKVPMLLIDPADGHIVDANVAAETYYGYPLGQLREMNIDRINTLPHREIAEEMSRADRDEKTNFIFRHRLASGEIRFVEVHSGAVKLKDRHLLYSIVHDITDRRRAENSLKMESEKNLALLRNASDGIHIIDGDGNVIEASDSFCAMLGYRREEMIGMNISRWDEKFKDQALSEVVRQLNTKHVRNQFETSHRRKDGTFFDVEVSSIPLELGGKLVLFNSSRDITERKLVENNLRIAATAFESQEGILITDANNVILRVNQAVTRITGYTAEDLIGKNPSVLSSGRQDAKFYAAMWDSINRKGGWEGEIWNRRKDGEVYPEHLSITAVKDRNSFVTNYVAAIVDITSRKQSEERIQHLAFYDPLTELPNRRLLLDRLQQALASSWRGGRQGALLFIDLDNFKTINDTLGHDMGDVLLQQVAERLTSCVREGDTVARIGGDEFVVMLEDLSGQSLEAAEQAEAVGNKILATLNHTYLLAKHECHCTPSIGVTQFHGHERGVEDLFKQADIAMYQAKKAGRNTLRFFDPQMQDAINARATLEGELRKALENRLFHLHYQIQVDSSNHPIGAEALIRWNHPERGLVSPAHFIPLAEENGLILPIGQWVLETACAQIRDWHQNVLTRDLVLAVNVSAKQFHQAGFVAQVKAAVQQHGIDPLRLKLELTESLLLEDVEDTISTMNALKEIGIRFSLDDFGTGYSSLQYLKRLPLDQLKIDQSFVREISSDSSDRAIVRTIIAMAQSLKLTVIAEGVETEEQRQYLLSMNCPHYQGYLFGKPVPIEQFEAPLKQDRQETISIFNI